MKKIYVTLVFADDVPDEIVLAYTSELVTSIQTDIHQYADPEMPEDVYATDDGMIWRTK